MDWRRLPSDTIERCSFLGDLASICGRQAAFIYHERCGCGEVDMSLTYCEAHKMESDENEERSSRSRLRVEPILNLPPGIVGWRRKRDGEVDGPRE